MNGYLVPANAKRGTLIFNIFRPFDLIMFGTGAAITLLLLVLVDSNDTIMILLSCLPVGVTGLLVVPIPNYHNVLNIDDDHLDYFGSLDNIIKSFEKYVKERQDTSW